MHCRMEVALVRVELVESEGKRVVTDVDRALAHQFRRTGVLLDYFRKIEQS